MKTLLLITVLYFTGKPASTVYVCASPDSKKYHLSKDCRGLNACSHEVKEISLSDAKAGGKGLCGWED